MSPFTNNVIRDYEHRQNRRQQEEDEYIFFEIVLKLQKNQYWWSFHIGTGVCDEAYIGETIPNVSIR